MKAIVMFFVVLSLLIAGCSAHNNIQMANPASVNCEDKGGTLEIVTDKDGGQLGMCTLEDGQICEEWAFMRGECPEKQVACTMEAKLCPDGSAVGRSGPNCEFAECPDEVPVVACREDAKVCPDGSAVGRLPPDCEFPACPGEDTTGYLEGKISIGPICPVERYPEDPNCLPSKATFDAWKVAVFKDGNKVAELEPDEQGNYNLALDAGRYKLDFIEHRGIGSTALPLDITIRAAGTTTLNIDIDTGIR
jgi:putative hemolysin